MAQRLPERPATPTRPGRRLHRNQRSEQLSALTTEERPRDREVAGRIAHRRAPEVENAGQSALTHEKVGPGHISVHPHARSVARGVERTLPDSKGGTRV